MGNNIKMNLQEIGSGAWTVLIWLRIGTGGGVLWTRVFNTMRGISSLANNRLVCQWLCSMEQASMQVYHHTIYRNFRLSILFPFYHILRLSYCFWLEQIRNYEVWQLHCHNDYITTLRVRNFVLCSRAIFGANKPPFHYKAEKSRLNVGVRK